MLMAWPLNGLPKAKAALLMQRVEVSGLNEALRRL
jgi:hypothetical protein